MPNASPSSSARNASSSPSDAPDAQVPSAADNALDVDLDVDLPSDPSEWIALAVSVGTGAVIAVMLRINATLGEHVGALEGSFVVHVVGTVFATLLVIPRMGWERVRRIRETPGRLFVGGVLGVVLVLVANLVVPVLGVALTLCLSVAANLLFSTIADHFGWFGLPVFRVTPRRIVGLLLVTTGVLLVAFGGSILDWSW